MNKIGIKRDTGPEGTERFLLFYGAKCALGNFYYSPFFIDDIQFQNTEQYFHYKKAEYFDDRCIMELILNSTDPYEQKKLGRKVKKFNENEWKLLSVNVMRKGNLAKFSQNSSLRALLLSSENDTLVEASPWDKIWGNGLAIWDEQSLDRSKWTGENKMGKVLMEVRESLKI